ncbi:MAG: hypothetical protein ACJ8E8_12210 [Sphingomicrobium sp.]
MPAHACQQSRGIQSKILPFPRLQCIDLYTAAVRGSTELAEWLFDLGISVGAHDAKVNRHDLSRAEDDGRRHRLFGRKYRGDIAGRLSPAELRPVDRQESRIEWA